MARFTFKLPDIGEGIAEAEIVAWHVKVGDILNEDQPLADMMTDKATVEMESPVAGVVVELAGEIGDRVSIGAVLAVIETAEVTDSPVGQPPSENAMVSTREEPPVSVPDNSPAEVSKPIGSDAHRIGIVADPVRDADIGATADSKTTNIAETSQEKAPGRLSVLASPAVRARAQHLGVDLGDVKVSEGDRVRHADLDAFLRYGAGQGYHPPQAKNPRADEQIKVIGLRRKIAENMAASKRNIPHFSYVEEIDVTALEGLRADLNTYRGSRSKLTFLPLLIVAICKAIPEFPMINARYDDQASVVTRHGAVHLGIATQTDAGLMVPVIRDAQNLNVWQLAAEITRLAEAARTGKIKVEDLTGSTLTVTSLGPLGGIATTPVINRPEVAIIGPNKIVERPVFRGDAIVRAKLMNLSISCDHRVVDGWDAASFVQALKNLLETPVLLFAGE